MRRPYLIIFLFRAGDRALVVRRSFRFPPDCSAAAQAEKDYMETTLSALHRAIEARTYRLCCYFRQLVLASTTKIECSALKKAGSN